MIYLWLNLWLNLWFLDRLGPGGPGPRNHKTIIKSNHKYFIISNYIKNIKFSLKNYKNISKNHKKNVKQILKIHKKS